MEWREEDSERVGSEKRSTGRGMKSEWEGRTIKDGEEKKKESGEGGSDGGKNEGWVQR